MVTLQPRPIRTVDPMGPIALLLEYGARILEDKADLGNHPITLHSAVKRFLVLGYFQRSGQTTQNGVLLN